MIVDQHNKQLRLSQFEQNSIKNLFHKHFIKGDKLWIFGSRADLTKKGGDIDLYIETSILETEKITQIKIGFLVDLKQKIGEQKIDLVVNITSNSENLSIYKEAKTTGVRLV
jgi:hypothetical protein